MSYKTLFAGAAALLIGTPVYAGFDAVPSGKYTIEDTHAYITFSYSHLGFSNPVLSFDDFDVTVMLDNSDVTKSSVKVEIDADSIDSQVEKFDGHLKSDDMFDVANFPTIAFVATQIVATGEDTMDITGDLTIKNVTKPITLSAKLNKAGPNPRSKTPTLGMSASANMKRKEWDMGYATPFVGDDVTINIEVELVHSGS
ncbi:MAG: YceI family protein [Pseudomonadota bacterium]